MKTTTEKNFILIDDYSDESEVKFITVERGIYNPDIIIVSYVDYYLDATHFYCFNHAESVRYDIMGVGENSKDFEFDINSQLDTRNIKIVECTTTFKEIE